jgi:hypothetical protein
VYRESLAVERAQSNANRGVYEGWRAHLQALEWNLEYWLRRLS